MIFRKHIPQRMRLRAAFSLVEVCLAIGLVAFCLVALLGLFQAGLRQEAHALDQVGAVHILEAAVDEVRGLARQPHKASANQTTSPRFGLQLPASGAGAVTSSSPLSLGDFGESVAVEKAAYRLYYSITPPSSAQGAYVPHKVRLIVAWPGTAEFAGEGAGLTVQKARGVIETSVEINGQ